MSKWCNKDLQVEFINIYFIIILRAFNRTNLVLLARRWS